MQRVAILGPGGVGGFLAAALVRAGDAVTVVAREETAAVITRDGITLTSAAIGDIHAAPAAMARLTQACDVLFIATKAIGLGDALERIDAPAGLVVPLLNGLDHLALLRERFGAGAVPAATIRIESDRPGPGQIVQSSPQAIVEVAFDEPARQAALPSLVAMLDRAGLVARIGASESQVMWSKLARLNALATTTTVADAPIGTIREDPEWRRRLIDCIEETAAVGNADGATLDPAATLNELDNAHPGLGSSMQRDLAAGRSPELDAIQGSVLRAAARHGLRCPTVEALAAQIAERAGLPAPTA